MKRYKLKKDLPTFKEGEIFYLSDSGNLIRESDNIFWTLENICSDEWEVVEE